MWSADASGIRIRASVATVAAAVVLATLAVLALSPVAAADGEGLLDPTTIPKWVNELSGPPPVYVPTVVTDRRGNVVSHDYVVTMSAFMEQVLPPGYDMTPVWGYGGEARDAVTGTALGFVRNSPAPTFEAIRGIPIHVKWINDLDTAQMFPVDPTLHWADPNGLNMESDVPGVYAPYPPGYPDAQFPVPLVPHLHGGEVPSAFDGGPKAWFTYDGIHGENYNSLKHTNKNAAIYEYPNLQEPTTLWYHDHALGITRINVLSGLAGFYLLRDPDDSVAGLLPSGEHEMPIVIQDRTFSEDGSFFFPAVGVNPEIHPYWNPEFFGDTIMVNGKVWPNMNVDSGVYRLRLLDGSNARFYTLSFSNGMPFTVIGTEGGYLRAPVTVTKLTFAPGERRDVLVDFTRADPGDKILLLNTAKAPFPGGSPPDPNTVGQIMQFTVGSAEGPSFPSLPRILDEGLRTYPSLPTPSRTRVLTLFEVQGENGPLEVLLNGQNFDAPISEKPIEGTTEDWVIVDITEDAHPIHLHLVQFQVVSRQKIAADAYKEDWLDLNGMPPYMAAPTELPVGPYLIGQAKGAPAIEQGWKDTVQVFPGEITVIRVRFTSQDGSPYPFDPTEGPGYVWHCHILDHEDNEMMRPYEVAKSS